MAGVMGCKGSVTAIPDGYGRDSGLAEVKAALGRARGDVARQIVPQHFMLNTCYGAATSCADE